MRFSRFWATSFIRDLRKAFFAASKAVSLSQFRWQENYRKAVIVQSAHYSGILATWFQPFLEKPK